MKNRIQHNDDGSLDEIVTDGGTHLEHLDGRQWFLNCIRADGSSFAVWFTGKIQHTEERPAPKCWGCGKDIPANSHRLGWWLACPACGWSARAYFGADTEARMIENE